MAEDNQSQTEVGKSRNSITQPLLILIVLVASGIATFALGLDGSGDTADDSERAVASPTETAVYEPAQAEESPSPTPTTTATVPAPTSTPQPEPTIVPPVPTSVPELAEELESAIDPLFITYVCDERHDPGYPAALDRWGYLTLFGKTVICLELFNQDYEFVSKQQQLLDQQIQNGEFSEYSHMKSFQEDSPDAFYRNAALAGGMNPNNPFGTARFESITYYGADLLLLANTGVDQIPSIERLHEGIKDWAASNSRAPFRFENPGQVLSPTLTERNNLLARLLDGVQDRNTQNELVFEVLYAFHQSRSTSRWNLQVRGLEQAYDSYLMSPTDLWFHEWLLINHEIFLSDFWPNEDWTPAPAP